MSSFVGNANYQHGSEDKIGVLLVNLGTPAAPTPAAVRAYLKQFLSDGRVIEMASGQWHQRLLWWCILRCGILPFRSKRSAAAYAEIWTDEGSPLLVISRQQQAALQRAFTNSSVEVALAMSYGEPSIAHGIDELLQKNCAYLLVLPMYPHYAGSTVGSVFDEVTAVLRRRRAIPHFRFISSYGDEPQYIKTLADSIAAFQSTHGKPDKLLFSFHGTPVDMLLAGDPYHCHCRKTARLTAESLGLTANEWQVTFQSRFGKAVWLQPYTDKTLEQLGRDGTRHVQVVCPAFSADCLETLEEIAGENKEIFQQAGGGDFAYIPALNDSDSHIKFLHQLISNAISDWQTKRQHDNHTRPLQAAEHARLRPHLQA